MTRCSLLAFHRSDRMNLNSISINKNPGRNVAVCRSVTHYFVLPVCAPRLVMVNTRCMTRRQFIALFIALAFAFAERAAPAADLHDSPEAKTIVALVNDAAKL